MSRSYWGGVLVGAAVASAGMLAFRAAVPAGTLGAVPGPGAKGPAAQAAGPAALERRIREAEERFRRAAEAARAADEELSRLSSRPSGPDVEGQAQDPGGPAPKDPAKEAALGRCMDWLKKLDPARFGDLTLEEVRHLRALSLDEMPITDADLENLACLDDLEILSLYRTGVTGEGFVHLAGMKSLRALDLVDAKEVREESLRFLEGIKTLRSIQLRGDNFTDAGLARLRGLALTEVWIVSIGGTVGDAGLASLSASGSLRKLELCKARVTDAGLACLRGNPLEELGLNLCGGVTDAGVRHLSDLTTLKRLDLLGTRVTDEGLAALAGNRDLTFIRLSAHNTDRALELIWGFPSLKKVMLSGGVSAETARRFQEAHPGCVVEGIP